MGVVARAWGEPRPLVAEGAPPCPRNRRRCTLSLGFTSPLRGSAFVLRLRPVGLRSRLDSAAPAGPANARNGVVASPEGAEG